MTDENTAVVDGPRTIRVRVGKKGPGKFVAIAKTQADADGIAEILKASEANVEVVITPYEAPTIITVDEYQEQTEAEREQKAALDAVLSKLSDEEKAVLKNYKG